MRICSLVLCLPNGNERKKQQCRCCGADENRFGGDSLGHGGADYLLRFFDWIGGDSPMFFWHQDFGNRERHRQSGAALIDLGKHLWTVVLVKPCPEHDAADDRLADDIGAVRTADDHFAAGFR